MNPALVQARELERQVNEQSRLHRQEWQRIQRGRRPNRRAAWLPAIVAALCAMTRAA
jgi:hypothetical protein